MQTNESFKGSFIDKF